MQSRFKFNQSRFNTAEDDDTESDAPKFVRNIYYTKTQNNSLKGSMMKNSSGNDSSTDQLDDDASIKMSELLE